MSTHYAYPKPAPYAKAEWRSRSQCLARRNGPPAYGLLQEERLKRGLAHTFEVIASADLDYLLKLDCVVRDRNRAELPAIGIQVTLRAQDSEKLKATLTALRRTRAVSRAVYLVLESDLEEAAFPPLVQLLRLVARIDRQLMVVAVLRRGPQGPHVEVKDCFTLVGEETESGGLAKKGERI